jgi:hypothetical protein
LYKSQKLLFCLFLLSVSVLFAQKQYTLSGYIKDAKTGEDLIGATIFISKFQKGTVTNGYGFFSLTAPDDSCTAQFSYLGYITQNQEISLKADKSITIYLSLASREIEEIEVKGDNYAERVNSTQMSMNTLTAKEAKQIPVIFGEVDLLKVLQLKPGVQNPGEGFSGLYVRGGSTDQNLFLIDEATVYNPTHIGGLFSVFNADAVKSIDLYKGGFPAQYGGRLSSIVDVKMNEGNKQKFSGAGGIGLISSRLTLEAPIKKNKGSFIVSGRRTYFDLFTEAYNKSQEGVKDFQPIPGYYFYDLNTKINYELGPKDRIFLSGYFGRDVLGYNTRRFNFNFDWGNIVGTLRWNHIFTPKLFSNLSIISSDYRYNITNNLDVIKLSIGSTVSDYNIKYDWEYLPNTKHNIKFGLQYYYHQFLLGRLNVSSQDSLFNFNGENKANAHSMSAYFSDDFDLTFRLKINVGARISSFYNATDNKPYVRIEPRVSARYKLSENTSLKASYARMNQYVNLISNTGASLPWDFWYPANAVVKPQYSDQFASGISTTFGDGKFLFSYEAFYKYLGNQIDFRDGAQIFLNPNLDQEFVFGQGWAYGSEFYLEKKEGKTRGWIGYTLQWNNRQFDAINGGNIFPSRFDRRHDISLVLTHELSKRITLTATFVYGTGNAISLPFQRAIILDVTNSVPLLVPIYGDRNTFRMAPFHKIDIGMVYKFKPKWGESDLTINIYNLYNRRNPFFIYFDSEFQDNNEEAFPSNIQAKQVSLFPILPALTYNFKF